MNQNNEVGVNWVLSDWLPESKLTLLAGAPIAGKSAISLSIAAKISNGDTPPIKI